VKRFGARTKRFEYVLAVVGVLAALAVTGASAADFDGDNGPCHETPGNTALLRCPTGYVGVPYEVVIAVEKGSGCEPYDWFEVRNSVLPAGLTMTRSGVISGVPTGAGLTRFWLWLHDLTAAEGGPSWCVAGEQSEREFSIPIDPGLAITNVSVKPGTVGEAYSETLTARRLVTLNPPTGSDEPATWSVQSGALPSGVTLSPQGALAGAPTTEGSFQFVVRAQIADGQSATSTYTLVVRQPVLVRSQFGSARPPRAEVGIRLATTSTATGGAGTYAWSISSGALPAGVTLNSTNGTISGTPQTVGRFAFDLSAADGEGRVATVSAALSVAPKLTLKTLRLKPAKLGRPYHAKLVTAGGVQPVRWTLRGRLPHGLRFAKKTGIVIGLPRQIGRFRLAMEARDALGATSHKTFVLLVKS
jgi:large repetitive protein